MIISKKAILKRNIEKSIIFFPSDYATRGFDMTFDDAIGAE
jgi:hypothetical protein